MNAIFSVDVEDWFHILDVPAAPGLLEWDFLPSRVETNFLRMLDLFEHQQVRATCFFLGWVAHRYPRLVKEATARGHEIASHGYTHQLVYKVQPRDFYEDAVKAREAIEDAAGHRILGYRASGFSVTETVPWFFEKVAEAGYLYDSSVFPAPRGHGGMKSGRYAPYTIGQPGSGLIEFPITVAKMFGRSWCFFGGGYLRLAPLMLIERAAAHVIRKGRPVIFYVHPREIDPDGPRLSMPVARRFKCYVNLGSTWPKITALQARFDFATFEDYIATHFPEWHCTVPKTQTAIA